MEPTAHAAASGVCNDITTVPVEFFTYAEFAQKDSAEQVCDRWIYVFKRYGWGTSLNAELFADADGALKLVNWKGKHWSGKDERPADVAVKNNLFEVNYRPDEHDIFFFLSQVQLARERIGEYTRHSGLETVGRRGMHFDPADSAHVEPIGDDCTGCRVYLTDHIRIAKGRHDSYKKALDRQADFLEDEQDSTEKMLAVMTVKVAESIAEENEDVLSWFDKEAAQNEIADYDSEREAHEGQVAIGAAHLCSWMERADYREMLFDYTGTEALEDQGHDVQADLSRGLSQSERGQTYLEEMLQDKESWHNKVVVPAGKHLFGQSKRAVGAAGKALDLFSELVVGMSGRSLRGAASLTHSFFKLRYETRVSFFKTVRGKGGGLEKMNVTYAQFMEGGAVTRGLDADTTSTRLKKTAAAGKVSMTHLGAVLGIVNLALTSKSAAEAKGTEKQGLAVASLVAAIADVSAVVTDWTASRSTTKVVGGAASIVGGVTAYSTSVYKLAARSPNMDNGVVVGLSLSALGGAFAAAEGVSALTGSLFLGIGSTGIGLIGIGLAAAGAAAVYYFKETKLEKWFKQCPWGIEAKSRPAQRHLNDLFEILAEFEVRCDVLETVPEQVVAPGSDFNAEYTLRFRIFPGLFYPDKSEFSVSELTLGGNETAPFNIEHASRREFDDESVLYVNRGEGGVHEITRAWGLTRRPGAGTKSNYDYTVELDLFGDGQYTVEEKDAGSQMPIVQPQ